MITIPRSIQKIVITSLGAVMLFIACSKSSDTVSPGTGNTPLDCATVTAKAYSDVAPIFQTKCATDGTCHGSGSTNGPGPLINYSAIFTARSSVRAAVASGEMPKTGSITTVQKNSILCWIDSGAENN